MQSRLSCWWKPLKNKQCLQSNWWTIDIENDRVKCYVGIYLYLRITVLVQLKKIKQYITDGSISSLFIIFAQICNHTWRGTEKICLVCEKMQKLCILSSERSFRLTFLAWLPPTSSLGLGKKIGRAKARTLMTEEKFNKRRTEGRKSQTSKRITTITHHLCWHINALPNWATAVLEDGYYDCAGHHTVWNLPLVSSH